MALGIDDSLQMQKCLLNVEWRVVDGSMKVKWCREPTSSACQLMTFSICR